jgi:two-component system KDP operon response regulator KdpE
MHILLIEDFQHLARMLSLVLSARGHDVAIAATGAEALQHVAADGFDLVLCDLCLPDTNGYALLPRLKSCSASTVIATSASLDPYLTSHCVARGFDGFIHKPFCIDDVLALVAQVQSPRAPAVTLFGNASEHARA